MATNDYSSRSKKELDFGDEPHKHNFDTATPIQAVPQKEHAVKEKKGTDATEIENHAENIAKDIDALLTIKLIAIIVSIIFFFLMAVFSTYFYIFIILILVAIVASISLTSKAEAKFRVAINDLYHRFGVQRQPAGNPNPTIDFYEKIFRFSEKISDCKFAQEGKTIITVEDREISACHLDIAKYTYSRHGIIKQPIFACEYYQSNMSNPYADGVFMINNGTMPAVCPPLYYDAKYRFFFLYDNLRNCDIGRITHLADQLTEYLKGIPFMLFYDDGGIHLFIREYNEGNFSINFYDFSVKLKIQRIAKSFARRIQIAEILVSA